MFAVLFIVFAILFSVPATWLIMLFLGNVGVHVGFFGALPAGILMTFFVAGAGAPGLRSWRS